jgi:antitoxin (DNA-binding transcriptional repressor) of toxin-antitoxin stability system
MTETIPLEEVQARLSELIAGLGPGDEVLITENERLVAKLTGAQPVARAPRQPGSAQGRLVIHAEDDEHLADFKEYMPS